MREVTFTFGFGSRVRKAWELLRHGSITVTLKGEQPSSLRVEVRP